MLLNKETKPGHNFTVIINIDFLFLFPLEESKIVSHELLDHFFLNLFVSISSSYGR